MGPPPRIWAAAALSLFLHGLVWLLIVFGWPQPPSAPPPQIATVELLPGEPAAPATEKAPNPTITPVTPAAPITPTPPAAARPAIRPRPAPNRPHPPPAAAPVPEEAPRDGAASTESAPAPAPAVPVEAGAQRHGDPAGAGGGGGAPPADVINAYLGAIRQKIQRSLIYPPDARQLGLTGRVVVAFRIEADGKVAPDSLCVVGGSDDSLLRAGALATIREIASFAPPPVATMRIEVPVAFTLYGSRNW